MTVDVKRMNIIKEGVAGKEGKAYAEILGKRYVLASLKKFEAKFKTNISKHNILGISASQSRPAGWEGSWEATLYYNQGTLRELAKMYAEKGIMPAINIQIVNEDPMSVDTVGRQSITFTDCLCEEMILAVIDTEEECLEEDVSGTFNGFIINERFKDLTTA